jgi:hypothetical protein
MSLTVAGSLLFAVPRRAEWMRLPIFIPVAGALFAPLPRAFAASLGVGGIVGESLAAVVGAALPLASRAAADDLSGMAFRGLKRLQAMRAGARWQTNSSEVCFQRNLEGNQNLWLDILSPANVGRTGAECRNCYRVPTASPPAGRLASLAPASTG